MRNEMRPTRCLIAALLLGMAPMHGVEAQPARPSEKATLPPEEVQRDEEKAVLLRAIKELQAGAALDEKMKKALCAAECRLTDPDWKVIVGEILYESRSMEQPGTEAVIAKKLFGRGELRARKQLAAPLDTGVDNKKASIEDHKQAIAASANSITQNTAIIAKSIGAWQALKEAFDRETNRVSAILKNDGYKQEVNATIERTGALLSEAPRYRLNTDERDALQAFLLGDRGVTEPPIGEAAYRAGAVAPKLQAAEQNVRTYEILAAQLPLRVRKTARPDLRDGLRFFRRIEPPLILADDYDRALAFIDGIVHSPPGSPEQKKTP